MKKTAILLLTVLLCSLSMVSCGQSATYSRSAGYNILSGPSLEIYTDAVQDDDGEIEFLVFLDSEVRDDTEFTSVEFTVSGENAVISNKNGDSAENKLTTTYGNDLDGEYEKIRVKLNSTESVGSIKFVIECHCETEYDGFVPVGDVEIFYATNGKKIVFCNSLESAYSKAESLFFKWFSI